ncbi:PAS domain S-box protein [Candidatus Laterigemmans baculatus]|uniref:PAS domain S-box protein n=1 Tax=Candidatus Laterigemmans baculatus TaxID=2770505 RepID=UPI0013DC4326|nr:PAS domain S-box protein [Candidatus Laterigemmans baculatus]
MLEFLRRFRREPRAAPASPAPEPAAGGAAASRRVEASGANLLENKAQFAKVVAGVRDYAIFLLDRDGNVQTWNTGAELLKSYRAEEILGEHFSRFYPAESIAAGWPQHELKVAASAGRFEDEGWRIRQDGSKFWASVVITALRDDAGEVTGFLKITRDLTLRKHNEEKLRLSEARFRLLVDGVQDYAIYMLDPEGRVTTWNNGAERLKGYSAAAIIGEHFSLFYPPEAIERGWPEKNLRQATAVGRVEDEGWRVRRDGSQFWAGVTITAVRDDEGQLLGFAKVTRDLTERRAAEERSRKLHEEEAARKAAEKAAVQIEQQREQLYVTLSSIGDGVVVTDQHGRITFLNPVAVSLTGWSEDDAIGKPLEAVFRTINEDSRKSVPNPVDTVFRENRVVELANHTALVTKDGREVPIEDSAAPIRGKGGEISGAVLVFRDVSETRRARETQLYLAAIVESSDDAIIGQTLDGRIASWNRGAEQLYGYATEEIVGKPLSILVPDDHPEESPTITERVARGEYIEHFETQRVRRDGSRVDVSLTISPVKDAEGRIIGASKIARDITGRKEEERRKNEFLALLAHELRNPLAPLRNGLQVLQLSGDDPDVLSEVRTLMERQLQHLVRLVDDLLDMSRISRGKLHLQRQRIPIAQAVEHALEIVGQAISEQGQELTVNLPDDPLLVDADETRLAQVICNLLMNAVKYSDPGSSIELTVEREGAEALIRVRDQGIGIPEPMLPRVFDMFIQVDRSLEKAQGGLGVGLAIVKRLVEMHGGSIAAQSEGHGKGSEFIIRLPLVLSVVQHSTPASTAADAAPRASNRRILVVDDNRDAATSLTMMLKRMGNVVRVAHDGQAGVEAAADFRPDLILLDIGMPKLNGYDAAQQIRRSPWGKSVKIVALTGWGQEEDRRKSQAAGFDLHLVKPVEPAEIEKLLAGLCTHTA